MRTAFLAALLLAGICVDASAANKKFAAPSKEPIPCAIGDPENYRIEGDIASQAAGAIAGDLSASQRIVSRLEQNSEHGMPGTREACRLKLWREVSALNGDVHSAYELAFGTGATDWYWCGRSKYWASFVIRRIESSTRTTKSREADLRIAQMKEVLSKQCPVL